MACPTPEQWELVKEHLDLRTTLALWASRKMFYLLSAGELLEELEDAALDGLIEASKGHRRDDVSFRSWAAGCIKKKMLERIQYLFALKRRPAKLCHLGFDPPDRLAGDHGSPVFAELVASLSPVERQVITLRFLEDLTQDDAGRVLGMGERSIRRVESKALERLRRFHF